jgi:hypothetical protein
MCKETSIDVLHLQYAGTPSQYSGNWHLQETGIYEAIVYAHDPADGNTGVDSVAFNIMQPG